MMGPQLLRLSDSSCRQSLDLDAGPTLSQSRLILSDNQQLQNNSVMGSRMVPHYQAHRPWFSTVLCLPRVRKSQDAGAREIPAQSDGPVANDQCTPEDTLDSRSEKEIVGSSPHLTFQKPDLCPDWPLISCHLFP